MPEVGMPPRVFLFTIDQLAVMLELPVQTLHTQHIFHEGRDVGTKARHHMLARNIAPPNERPDWRVMDKEFVRWMRLKGYKYYDRSFSRT